MLQNNKIKKSNAYQDLHIHQDLLYKPHPSFFSGLNLGSFS